MTVLPVKNADVPQQDRSGDPAPDPAADLGENLLRYAELGGFTLAVDTHAWYTAADTVTNPEDARAGSTALAEVRGGDLSALREAADRLAAEAALRESTTVAEVVTLVGLLRRVGETAATLRSGAYEADLDALAAATASGSWRKERGLKISWGRRRKLRAEARRLAVADRPRRDALHAALLAAAAEREEWQALAPVAGTVARPVDAELLELTGQCADALAGGLRELSRLLDGQALDELVFDELGELVEALAADEGTLYRLPELRTLRAELEGAGLAELLAELTAARADRAAAEAAWTARLAHEAHEVLAGESDAADVELVVVEADTASEVEVDAVTEVVESEDDARLAAEDAAADVIVIPSPSPEPALEVIAPAADEVEVEVEVEEEEQVAAEPEPVAEAVVAEMTVEDTEEAGPTEAVEAVELVEEPAVAVVEETIEVVPSSEAVAEEPTPVAEAEPVAAETPAPVVTEDEPAPVADEPVAAVPEVTEEPEPAPVAIAEEPIAEPEPVAEEPTAEALVAEEPEPVPSPVAEAPALVAEELVTEPASVAEEPTAEAPAAEELVTEPAPVAEEPTAESPAVAEPVAESLVAEEPVAEPASVAEEPTAESPGAEEPVAESPVAEEPVTEDPEPAARAPRRPQRPDLTPGRPITAYAAEELLALVRWIDSDYTTRTDDELLRAAMKELGFARLGPRIKEALAAAVTAARHVDE
ncbi:hypothetical protein P3T35_004989 [Kitasatospora sp. GP30]|uniref:hypothetical protein n=1 Tax=Kitasatospora sp. GP30 TaxID=3035084 RepID=UPI000C70EAAA|nr:hypothetical protein [Kitasatospora sp. GP30]MDH6142961.1 hypothetical protein [Kitasatospora sp. GP30]